VNRETRSFDNRILGAAALGWLRYGAYQVVIEGENFRKPKPMPASGENAVARSSKKIHSGARSNRRFIAASGRGARRSMRTSPRPLHEVRCGFSKDLDIKSHTGELLPKAAVLRLQFVDLARRSRALHFVTVDFADTFSSATASTPIAQGCHGHSKPTRGFVLPDRFGKPNGLDLELVCVLPLWH